MRSQKIVHGGFHWSLEMLAFYKLVKHNKNSKEKTDNNFKIVQYFAKHIKHSKDKLLVT
jgi:hypothetical protein